MIEQILSRLDGVKKRGPQGYMAKCPAHDDKTPSLAVTQLSDGRILVKCFAGCGASEIMSQIGLQLADLFPEGSLGEYRSFVNIEKSIQTKKQHDGFKDKVILEMADEMRARGERLSAKDLETERQAFIRVRNATPN